MSTQTVTPRILIVIHRLARKIPVPVRDPQAKHRFNRPWVQRLGTLLQAEQVPVEQRESVISCLVKEERRAQKHNDSVAIPRRNHYKPKFGYIIDDETLSVTPVPCSSVRLTPGGLALAS